MSFDERNGSIGKNGKSREHLKLTNKDLANRIDRSNSGSLSKRKAQKSTFNELNHTRRNVLAKSKN
jgi:hypothetical protein